MESLGLADCVGCVAVSNALGMTKGWPDTTGSAREEPSRI